VQNALEYLFSLLGVNKQEPGLFKSKWAHLRENIRLRPSMPNRLNQQALVLNNPRIS